MKTIIICLAILSLLSVSNEKKIRFLAAGLGGMGGLSNACNIVDKICLMWRSICGAFATVKSSYLKEILIKDGFDHYSGTTTLQYPVGVKEDRFRGKVGCLHPFCCRVGFVQLINKLTGGNQMRGRMHRKI